MYFCRNSTRFISTSTAGRISEIGMTRLSESSAYGDGNEDFLSHDSTQLSGFQSDDFA